MMLKERGKLTYENTLKDIFPDFPEYGKKIKIKYLLNHTSGLIDYEDLIPEGQIEQLKDKDVLVSLKKIDSTYFEPGTKYKYSNSGYALLALIVEKMSGISFAKFLKDNIFKPLGMNNTVAYENGISDVKSRAFGYSRSNSGFIRTDQSLTSAVLGDGGIYTSIMDYYKWDQALYTAKLIKRKTLNDAFTIGLFKDGTPIDPGYGFGWKISKVDGRKCLEHGGSTIGFTNHVMRIPEINLCILLLTNRNNVQNISDYVAKLIKVFGE
jgi:CubicO group peptidase (beta-lactamase class C family)